MAGDMAKGVEDLPCKHKALSSNPSAKQNTIILCVTPQ
jgi:hypothetical protein